MRKRVTLRNGVWMVRCTCSELVRIDRVDGRWASTEFHSHDGRICDGLRFAMVGYKASERVDR